MSKIITRSKFYFLGEKITLFNRSLDFDEGGGELQATLNNGDYTMTEIAAEIQRAMRVAGTQAYVGAFNRTTQEITISAPLAFDLLTFSGTRFGTAVYPLIGFDILADHTGLATYTSESPAGSVYETQHPVNAYISNEDSQVKENSTRNTTPLGISQRISFGDGTRIEMNIRLITNLLDLKNDPFFNNATGVSDFRTFFAFLQENNKVEFMPDEALPNTFFKVILESTDSDRDASEFKLRNMKTPEIYESGKLTFRKVLI